MNTKQTVPSKEKPSIKRQAFASLIALFLVGLALPSATAVDDEMPLAFGHYQISIIDAPARTIDFNARLERDGSTAGEMTFQDISVPADPKTGNDTDAAEVMRPFFLKADFDCLTVHGNSAVMSGNVTHASLERYVGKRVLLVVQDNGHGVGPAKRDKLTWGIYRPAKLDEALITDFERSDDQPGKAWVATDAERTDDNGMLSRKNEEIGCRSFPLSAFSFIDAKQGVGKIQVQSGIMQSQAH